MVIVPWSYLCHKAKRSRQISTSVSKTHTFIQQNDIAGNIALSSLDIPPDSGVVPSETIRELTKRSQKKTLLNLAEVTYIDSSGVGQLAGALTTARK
jgi:hypothetical protein